MKATVSGVRGIVGDDLGLADVLRFCDGFAGLVPRGRCVLGRDTRPSGEMVARTAAAALMARGVDVLDMGTAPTPAVFYESKKHGAGVMVTASHNPVEWNGLKFVLDGRGISGSDLDRISGARRAGEPDRYGSKASHASTYARDLRDVVGRVRGPVSVLVDAGGGAAADAAPDALRGAGCSVDELRGGVRPDPTAGGLGDLLKRSAEYDMGAAFDMDGDRLVLVMEGAVQPPDATLALGVAAAMGRGHDTFVFSRDTGALVEEYVKSRGGRVYRSPVGEANVVGEMVRTRAGAGGEGSSGGFILPGFNGCRDGMLAAGLAAVLVSEGAASDVLRETSGSCIIRTKIPADGGAVARAGAAIRDAASRTDASDGVWGMLGERSWVLVRRSNTENVVRLSAEAPTEREARDTVRWMSETMKGHGRE